MKSSAYLLTPAERATLPVRSRPIAIVSELNEALPADFVPAAVEPLVYELSNMDTPELLAQARIEAQFEIDSFNLFFSQFERPLLTA